MAPTPTGIRYHNCRNFGVGIVIWPALRSATDNNTVVWDVRSSVVDKLYINSAVTVDLSTIGILPSQMFVLAEDTMFDKDMWDNSQTYFYDPDPTITAYGTKWGGAEDGSFTYQDCIRGFCS